jgi:hypothetical protein
MPIRSAADRIERSLRTSVLANSSTGWSLIRKTSLSSDRSDGVRSSSRHKHGSATTSHAPFGTTSARVPMLGDCASITTCVTIDSRSDPTSSRCQISVSCRAPARGFAARTQARNCFRRTSVDSKSLEISKSLGARSRLVEPDGIEPTTSCLQSRRSPN